MSGTIAIIAPFIDSTQYNMDFTLRLRRNNRELTLATMYELASEGFVPEKVSRGIDYGDDIPAAGFYLEGLLRLHGYDTILSNRYDTASLQKLAEHDLFAICISTTMIITTDSLLALISSIREMMPGVCIIAGGSLLWKHYMQYLKHSENPVAYPMNNGSVFHPDHGSMEADALVVAPHGISSLLMVLKELEKGTRRPGDGETRRLGEEEKWRSGVEGKRGRGEFSEIPNLCLPGKDGFVFTKMVEEQVDYNQDYTRWDLVSEIPEKIPVRTSIGCPYRCRFCDFYHLFPKIFLRSRESLLEELKLAKARLGGDLAVIHVTDDNVFITKKRLYEVCGAITESGLNHWVGFMRGGEYSEDELEVIRRSGLLMGKIGVESGDQGQLDRMNKRQKIEKVKRGIEQLDANGISILMTFVVGFPGETGQTLQNTIDFLNNLSMTNLSVGYQVYPLVIFPLSELAQPAGRDQWQIKGIMDEWSHSTMNSAEASDACNTIFREVTNVPYSYSEESFFFNRAMFDFNTRRSLLQLRQQLTLRLMEGASWNLTGSILEEMARLMELPGDGISEKLTGEILVPKFR